LITAMESNDGKGGEANDALVKPTEEVPNAEKNSKTEGGENSKTEGFAEMDDNNDDDDDDEDFEDMSGSEEEEEDDDEEEMSADDETGESVPPSKTRVYLPGLEKLKAGEVLEHDPSAYVMLHRAEMNAPCLSFDILADDLGADRSDFPASCYVVCGTQSGGKKKEDKVMLLKMTNLTKTLKEKKKKEKSGEDEESESESEDESSDEEEEEDPVMKSAMINQTGACNRIRSTVINSKRFAASWSELGKVFIYDLTKPWGALAGGEAGLRDYNAQRLDARIKPCASFKGHLTEGFALDWSSLVPGKLISGDCKGGIHAWTPRPDAADAWTVDQRPFVGHKDSVEDLQWSPTEATVFASASVDKTLRIWDTRANPASANMLTVDEAHEADINVISWNKTEPFIVSGGDDAMLKVWDLRKLQTKTPTPVATFKHHSSAITSVEWHPTDSSVFASSGADDQIVQWDLAVEKDDISASDANSASSSSSAEMEENSLDQVPPQLLFIHMGQKEIKEIHWHPQIPGMMISTALDGINVFKTISV